MPKIFRTAMARMICYVARGDHLPLAKIGAVDFG
jgi:hypothetical protein